MKCITVFAFTLCTCLHAFAITEKEVYCYIENAGIKHPQVVFKQAIYESGHFKSHIFKTKKNLFGFRRSKGYLKFKTWQQSIDFYKHWQEKYYRNDDEDYYKFLQRKNFSGNKKFNYAKELKRIRTSRSINCNEHE